MTHTGHTDDRETVRLLLARHPATTRQYLFVSCYPLFKSVFDRYYTDCSSCMEFINAIYLHIMTPGVKTGVSKLEAFSFRCRLTLWLKIVSENYCRQLFARRDPIVSDDAAGDSFSYPAESIEIDMHALDRLDVERMLSNMGNERYRLLIQHRYMEEKSNEETAMLLGMTMANYYNKHRLAKARFCMLLREEGLI